MRLPKLLLILSVSSSLVGCGGKLKPTVCIAAPREQKLGCYDYRDNKPLDKSYQEVDGWACLSPVDFQNVLEACKRGSKGPLVNQCIVSWESLDFRCYNKVTETPNSILFADTENYVCLSPADDKQMLDYCKTTITQHHIMKGQ